MEHLQTMLEIDTIVAYAPNNCTSVVFSSVFSVPVLNRFNDVLFAGAHAYAASIKHTFEHV